MFPRYWLQACVLREFSPKEVRPNIYTIVDVLLHHIHLELQHGLSLQVRAFCLVLFWMSKHNGLRNFV